MHDRYVTDILKMCMKKFNAEKIIFDNLHDFDLHFAGGILLALLAANFLLYQELIGQVVHKAVWQQF